MAATLLGSGRVILDALVASTMQHDDHLVRQGPPGDHPPSKGSPVATDCVEGSTNSRILARTAGNGSGAIAIAVRPRKPCHRD
jgi:hypothetical protein